MKLGRKPNSGKPRVVLHETPVTNYTPPATVDRYSAVPAASWGMDGNDTVGDCTCADVDHEAKAMEVAAGNSEVVSTTVEVLAAYSAITGYNPADPSTDQGAEMQDVRNFWRTTGFTLGGQPHKILMFAELQASNLNLLKWGLDQLGVVGLGVKLPESAQQQFNTGQPWTVVEGSPIEGGHAIAWVGYDPNWAYIVTWGQVQQVAWDWFAQYVEEAWVVLDAEFVNAHSGADPLGASLYQVGQAFAQLTGEPNPVPAPPGPAPAPTPAPTPADPDQVLADTVRDWAHEHHIGGNERAAKAILQWLAETGR